MSKPDTAPKNLPPPVVTAPAPAKPAPAPTDTTASTQEQPAPKPRHKKPAQKPASQPNTATPPPVQQASNGTPEVSAIGQLSTGDSGDLRSETVRSLNKTERGLNSINRKLNAQEAKTSAQIREYIKQARAALASNDLDGAQTLATKAKLLLGELTQ